MEIRWFVIGIGISVSAGILSATHSAVLASGPAAGDSKKECLACHGPFDKLIEASSKYVAPSGEKTSPHRFVPHDSNKEEDIPECTHCHKAHPLDPLPAEGSIDLSKTAVQWCYDACHHEKNLTSCKKCHP
jgi:hypothetical protein